MKKIGFISSICSLSIYKLLVVLMIFGNAFYASGQIQVPFTQRTSTYTPTKVIYSINGDFTMIGNTNLTLQNYTDGGTNSNNIMILVDADGDASTTNSSSATLTLSTENGAIPSCSNIIYAGLYWTGRTDPTVTTAAKRNIKLRGPGQAGYQSFMANANDIRYPGDNDMYAAYVEVTDLVRQYGIGQYWVADMALTTGNGSSTGYYGGWGMIVVYENSKMKWRDVTVFDGYAYVTGNTSISYDLPISGFNTIQSGPVNMKLGLMAGEGDYSISGDYFQIQKVSDGSWLTLNHSGNAANNFFNSSIYTGGNARTPNLLNNTGLDISMFNIPNAGNSVITNNQTSTTFRYGSTQDTYIIFGMAMAVDAYVPTPEGLNTVQSIDNVPYVGNSQSALPGDEIEYKLEIRNKGTEPINNSKIVIPIPYASSYVSSSNAILFSPLPTPNNVYFNPLLGANGSIVWEIGTLPLPSDPNTLLGTLTYRIKVTEDCNLLSNNDCPPKILLNGTISGTGAISNVSSSLGFIQGFQNQGLCGGVPIYNPLIIPVDAIAYIAENCQTPQNISFTYCNVGASIPVTQVSGNFMPGSHFYNSYPVTQSTIEYNINHPFPATIGTSTYFSVPPGTTSCFYQFTINVTSITTTPTVSGPVSYCQGALAQPLTATPSNPSYILYYYETLNSLPQLSYTPPTSSTGVFTYYVAEGASSSCISPNKVPIIVTINPLPSAMASNNSPVCNGGILSLNSNGGTTYSWSGPNGFTSTLQNPSLSNFTNAGAGTYSVIVTDGNGCSASASTNVSSPFVIYASSTSGAISCNGGTTTVTVTANGGTAPYTGVGTYTVTAGTYNYTVTDANGCTANTSITVTEPTVLTAVSTSGVILCNRGTTIVTVTASGGTAPYTGVGTFTVNAGTYNYTVTDANGCTANTSITVTDPSVLTATSTSGEILCSEGTTTVIVSASGGTAPYNGIGTFTVSAGTYNYTVTDANGCTAVTSIDITEPSVLKASSASGAISCYGGTATVTVTANGGTAPYSGIGTFTVSAGTHNYTVTDANGCIATTSITVTEPTALTAASTSGAISCNGGTTTITVTANGGTAPYTGTGTFTVGAGTHNYTVTDANGCIATTSITVTEPSALTASSTSGAISCNGGTTTVTVKANGGVAPYTGIGTFTVSAGTHNYTVTDANGCIATTSVTVTEPTALTATSTSGVISCNGGTTTITVTANGGTAPYSGIGTFTVSAGTHNYTVTDANGCIATTSITVTEPIALTATSTSGAISCYGGTATLTVTANGGTAPYSGIGTFTVSAGTHTYTVTDANGCIATTSMTVTEPTALTATSASGAISCYGGTATVTVTANGGTAPYSGIGTFTVIAGTHNYTVTDANGCIATTSITVTEPTALTAASTSGAISCYGGTTTVTVTANGGTVPYSGIGTFTVSAVTHNYTVTDANGCIATTSITVTEPTALTATSTSGAISCNSGTTTVTVTANGGTAPYTGIGTFTVSAGTHNYTVTDANGCTANTSITITEPTILTAASTSGAISCNGGTTTVTVTANGGTAPYTGIGTFTVSAGTHNYTVTDANGCIATTSITVTEPTALTATSTSGAISCYGGTATVTVTANGGTAPYTGIGTFTVSAGIHNYTVTDANGCNATTSITVTEPSALTASSTSGTILCNGGTTTINVTANGGVAPYTGIGAYTVVAGTHNYTVTDANGCIATTSITVTEPSALTASSTSGTILCNGGTTTVNVTANGGFAPYTGIGTFTVSAGIHNYTVTDANGCIATTSITVTEPTALTASSTSGTILCNGGTTTVNVTANGGTAPYTGIGTFTVTAGIHNYTVNDANGCTANSSITISQPSMVNLSLTLTTPASCSNNPAVVTASVLGGVGPYSYTVDGIAHNDNIFSLTAGNHIIVVTDANGCQDTETIIINQFAPISLSLAVTTPIACNGSGSATVTATAAGVAPYTYTVDGVAHNDNVFSLNIGNHTVVVQDANGCQATATINITQPVQINLTLTVTAPVYCTTGTATVTATITGGTAPYSYFVDGIANSSNILQLTPGYHTIKVIDANGCQKTACINICPASPVSLCVSLLSGISCYGGTATVKANGSGGLAPYMYSADGGPYQSSNIFNLTAGTHTITVIDARGCTKTVTISLCQPSPFTLSLSVNNQITCNTNYATVAAVPHGGTSPYTYSVDGIAQSGSIFSITSGTHTVIVTDKLGCQATATITINQPTPVVFNLTLTSTINCYGGLATVTANVISGTAPFTYNVDGVYQNSNVFSLAAGNHTVIVRGANGCQSTQTIMISQPTQIQVVALVTTPVLCNGGIAIVTVNATGGTSPYLYKVDAGVYQTSNIFSLSSGNHSISVKDANGCTKSICITISEPQKVNLCLSVITPIVCNGGLAVVKAVASGGTAPYLYSADGGAFQTSNLFNLNAGSHTITVKDANGCTKTSTIIITQPAPVVINVTINTPILCHGGTANITVTATGGTYPYTFTVLNNGVKCHGNYDLPAGTYTFVATDANGCSDSITIVITEPDELLVNLTILTPVTCSGNPASVKAIVTGGTAPYSYKLDGVSQTSNIFAMNVGTHTVLVTDANGCQKSATITILAPPPIGLSLNITSPILCNGGLATVTAIVTGGTAPYTYSADGGAFQNSNVFSFAAGNHTVIVKDAMGCTKTSVITVTQPSAITVCLTVTSQITCNGGTAVVKVIASGGTAPYSYRADGGPFQTSNIFGLSAGNHTIIVRDANGCTKTTNITITQPASISLNLSVTGVISCYGGTTSIIAYAAGGIAPYSYRVDAGVYQSSSTLIVGGGNHTITVKDALGCEKSANITIVQPAEIMVVANITSQIVCNGGSAGITVVASGGVAPYLYSVDGSAFQNTGLFTLSGGNHTVTVKDANGCQKTTSIHIVEPTPMAITIIEGNPVCEGGISTITVNVTGGTGPYTYSILSAPGSQAKCQNVFYLPSGTYTITVTDAHGCTQTVTITVDCPDCNYLTYTQGGWGAPANGNNPGTYLNANFASAFPSGLTIGCTNKLRLTSAAAVIAFLPSGSTATKLPLGTITNPGSSYNNVLAGQLVAATLNVRFDQFDPNFSGSSGNIAGLQITTGDFIGWTVAQLIDSANKFIGGCGSHYTAVQYNNALTAFNESFDGGAKSAYLDCFNQYDNAENSAIKSSGMEDNSVTNEKKPIVYPVPVTDNLNIDWSNGITMVEVFDVLGKLLYSEKINKSVHLEIDFGKYPKGIYNIRINNSEVLRIVK